MTHPFHLELTITTKNNNENVSLSGELNDDDWNLLNEYLQYADELCKTKFVKDGMVSSLNIKGSTNTHVTFEAKLPDWDDVSAFLHKFRPIGLENESTNFYKICSILGKKLDHPYFRGLIKDQREIYSGKRMQSAIRVSINDTLLNSETVLQNWLNSFEYHRDKEKKKFIEDLLKIFPLDASKVLFIGLLAAKVSAIVDVATLVSVVIGKQRSMEGLIEIPDANQ